MEKSKGTSPAANGATTFGICQTESENVHRIKSGSPLVDKRCQLPQTHGFRKQIRRSPRTLSAVSLTMSDDFAQCVLPVKGLGSQMGLPWVPFCHATWISPIKATEKSLWTKFGVHLGRLHPELRPENNESKERGAQMRNCD